MRNNVRRAALIATVLAAAVVLLVQGIRERRISQGPEVFAFPAQHGMTFKEYVGRLATFRAPSRNARPDGYLYVAGLPRVPIYLVSR